MTWWDENPSCHCIFLKEFILYKYHFSTSSSSCLTFFFYVKSVQLWSFFWSVLFCIRAGYGDLNLLIQNEYRKTRTTKNSVLGHFSRSVIFLFNVALSNKLILFFATTSNISDGAFLQNSYRLKAVNYFGRKASSSMLVITQLHLWNFVKLLGFY